MKRVFVLSALAAFMVCSISVTAYAHPGKTDSDGGHYDWAIGEYHYHHGYPAHDHNDDDGDGIIDCPYDFRNKTGSNSGYGYTSSNDDYLSSVSSYNEGYNYGYDAGYDDGNATGYEKGFQEGADKQTPRWSLFLSLAVIVILFFVNRSLRSDIKQLRKNQEKTEKDLSDKDATIQMLTAEVDSANRAVDDAHKEAREKIFAAEIKAENLAESSKMAMDDALRKIQLWAYNYKKHFDSLAVSQNPNACVSDNSIPLVWVDRGSLPIGTSSPIHIPENVTFAIDGYPILGEQTVEKPYGDYTAFIFEQGRVYHMEGHCGNGYGKKIVHLFDILEKRQPCARCCKMYGVVTEIPQWYKDICNIQYKKR